MELVKISTIEQAKIINDPLKEEPETENTHPFYINPGAFTYENIFSLKHNGQNVGLVFLKDHGEGCAEIYKFYIYTPFRRCGLGRLAVETIISVLKTEGYNELCLEVLTFDLVPFWTRFDFEPLAPEFAGNRHFQRKI